MATVSTAAAPLLAGASGAKAATAPATENPHKPVDSILHINGRDHQLAFDVRTSLDGGSCRA